MHLFKLSNGNYAIEDYSVYAEGSLEMMRDFAKERLDIDNLEFEKAVRALRGSEHNCATFGIGGTYIATLNAKRTKDALVHCRAIRELRSDLRLAHETCVNDLEAYEIEERLRTLERTLDIAVVIAILEATECSYAA